MKPKSKRFKLTKDTRQCDFSEELEVNSMNGDAQCFNERYMGNPFENPRINNKDLCEKCVYNDFTMGQSPLYDIYITQFKSKEIKRKNRIRYKLKKI